MSYLESTCNSKLDTEKKKKGQINIMNGFDIMHILYVISYLLGHLSMILDFYQAM